MKRLIVNSRVDNFELVLDLKSNDVAASWHGSESKDKLYTKAVDMVVKMSKNRICLNKIRSIFGSDFNLELLN